MKNAVALRVVNENGDEEVIQVTGIKKRSRYPALIEFSGEDGMSYFFTHTGYYDGWERDVRTRWEKVVDVVRTIIRMPRKTEFWYQELDEQGNPK